eukprot:gene10331-8267_t
MVSAHVNNCINSAGLDKYVRAFSPISDEKFCALLMQDYGTYGVLDLEDKQKLFRLLKTLNAELKDRPVRPPGQAQAPPNVRASGPDLLDLDAHDGDLLSHSCGPALQLSPMGGGRAAKAPASIAPAQPSLVAAYPVTEADPPKIRVVVRKRPINRKEREKGDDDVVDCSMSGSYIVVHEIKQKVDLTKYSERHQFNFDVALDESVTNEEVYATTEFCDVSLYFSCFEIYGNKVFDLLNARNKLNILEDAKKKVDGVGLKEYNADGPLTPPVTSETLPKNHYLIVYVASETVVVVGLKEYTVVVVGLKEYTVTSVDLVKQLIEESGGKRSTGSTAANADSSRSHSIMQFVLKRPNPDAGKLGRGRAMAGDLPPPDFMVGKISFIDLAGSERGADTYDNNRQTRLEGAEINKSLLALKECIRALDGDARHVPFRGSKLTAVLRDSFVGAEARTVMIANISPSSGSTEHTEARTVMIASISPSSGSTEHSLNTLRYAFRVKGAIPHLPHPLFLTSPATPSASELRKDKADRTPGGVTPGENPAYYAAVARAATEDHDEPPAARSPAPEVSRASRPSPHKGVSARASVEPQPTRAAPAASASTSFDDDEDEIMAARDELMDTILEGEEQLITAHRMQIEETMELVRKEMALLTDVDQPGSAIDRYVEKLDGILKIKMDRILELKSKLEKFKDHLKQEEIMSSTQRPHRGNW